MGLKYEDELVEDALIKRFYEETGGMWTQREQPRPRDVIKWLIISGYFSAAMKDEIIIDAERGENDNT